MSLLSCFLLLASCFLLLASCFLLSWRFHKNRPHSTALHFTALHFTPLAITLHFTQETPAAYQYCMRRARGHHRREQIENAMVMYAAAETVGALDAKMHGKPAVHANGGKTACMVRAMARALHVVCPDTEVGGKSWDQLLSALARWVGTDVATQGTLSAGSVSRSVDQSQSVSRLST